MTDTTTSVLIKARSAISNQDNWYQGGEDWAVAANEPHQMCALTALDWALSEEINGADAHANAWPYTNTWQDAYDRLADAAIQLSESDSVEVDYFNDTHDHADVMAMFDLAIEQATA